MILGFIGSGKIASSVITGISKSKISYKNLPIDDPKQRQPDINLAKKELNWNPTIQIEEGLSRTIDYFKKII